MILREAIQSLKGLYHADHLYEVTTYQATEALIIHLELYHLDCLNLSQIKLELASNRKQRKACTYIEKQIDPQTITKNEREYVLI